MLKQCVSFCQQEKKESLESINGDNGKKKNFNRDNDFEKNVYKKKQVLTFRQKQFIDTSIKQGVQNQTTPVV